MTRGALSPEVISRDPSKPIHEKLTCLSKCFTLYAKVAFDPLEQLELFGLDGRFPGRFLRSWIAGVCTCSVGNGNVGHSRTGGGTGTQCPGMVPVDLMGTVRIVACGVFVARPGLVFNDVVFEDLWQISSCCVDSIRHRHAGGKATWVGQSTNISIRRCSCDRDVVGAVDWFVLLLDQCGVVVVALLLWFLFLFRGFTVRYMPFVMKMGAPKHPIIGRNHVSLDLGLDALDKVTGDGIVGIEVGLNRVFVRHHGHVEIVLQQIGVPSQDKLAIDVTRVIPKQAGIGVVCQQDHAMPYGRVGKRCQQRFHHFRNQVRVCADSPQEIAIRLGFD